MTYVIFKDGWYLVMAESKGLLGDYIVKRTRHEQHALDLSKEINRKLGMYDNLVNRQKKSK